MCIMAKKIYGHACFYTVHYVGLILVVFHGLEVSKFQ